MSKEVETGVALFARLIQLPDVSTILPVGVPAGTFGRNGFLQVSGDSGSGQTLLLLDMIARCILDTRLGGCGGEVLLFDLDHHWDERRLVRVLRASISSHAVEHENILAECLGRLRIIPCFSLDQLFLGLYHFENTRNPTRSKTSLICIDSVTAVYWSTRMQIPTASEDNIFYGKLAKVTARISMQFGIPFIVTCQTLFRSRHHLKNPRKRSNDCETIREKYDLDLTDKFMGTLWSKLPTIRIATEISPQSRRIRARVTDNTGTVISVLDMDVFSDKLVVHGT